MKFLVFLVFFAIALANALPTIEEDGLRSWPPLKNPPPIGSRCDAPDCQGLQIYFQPSHEPSEFFQCTVLGRYIVGTCPFNLRFSYTQQSCVLPNNWRNYC